MALKARGDLSLPASPILPVSLSLSPLVTENRDGAGPAIPTPSPVLLLLQRVTAHQGNKCPQTSLTPPWLQNCQFRNIQDSEDKSASSSFPSHLSFCLQKLSHDLRPPYINCQQQPVLLGIFQLDSGWCIKSAFFFFFFLEMFFSMMITHWVCHWSLSA